MSSSIIQPLETTNHPDLLGLITGGHRLNLDVVQCALSTRPDKVAAGQNFEVLLLLQNASDIDVDVRLDLELPPHDLVHKKGMFFSKSSHLLVGLQPAEVGYVILPISCSPKTQPGPNYSLSLDLQVARVDKNRKPARIRHKEGGGQVRLEEMPEKTRRELLLLRMVTWETQASGKVYHLTTTFEVLPPRLATLVEFNAGWQSLWTMADHIDENLLKQRVHTELEAVIAAYTTAEIIPQMPALVAQHFQRIGYPLQAAETKFISKLLTLVLCEVGVEQPSRINPHPVTPEWYKHLMRALLQEPGLKDYPLPLLRDTLFSDVIYDSVLHGFKMLKTVLNEDFGSPQEVANYAEGLRQAFKSQTPLSYAQVYLPLILAGVIANNRISLENENIRESIFEISAAHEKRQPELTADNAFVADLFKRLIDRSLDYVGGSL